MVNARRERDRAQLILLGCLALAFVVISLGLLINTTIYTESSSQALSNAQVDSATSLDLETRRGSRSLIHRVNLGPRDRTDGQLDDNVTSTIQNYSTLLGEQYARSRAASVDVSYNPAGSRHGTRVVQEEDGDFYEEFELDDGVNQRIGWFVINTNVSETDQGATDPFNLTVENDANEELYIEIHRNESTSGNEPNLTISTGLTGESTRTETFDPRRNRVVLDVVTGEVIADRPRQPDPLYSLADLAPPHEAIDVSSSDSDKFHGSWEFVTNRSSNRVDATTDPSFGDCTASPAADDACRTPAVWTANVTTALEGEGVAFHRNRNVTIYGADR